MNSIILSLFFYFRHRSVVFCPKTLTITNFMIFFTSLAFALEDENMAGLNSLFNSPNSVGCMIFFVLVLYFKQQCRLIYCYTISKESKQLQRYQNIEEKLFMEEFEDPDQVFEIKDSVHY